MVGFHRPEGSTDQRDLSARDRAMMEGRSSEQPADNLKPTSPTSRAETKSRDGVFVRASNLLRKHKDAKRIAELLAIIAVADETSPIKKVDLPPRAASGIVQFENVKNPANGIDVNAGGNKITFKR